MRAAITRGIMRVMSISTTFRMRLMDVLSSLATVVLEGYVMDVTPLLPFCYKTVTRPACIMRAFRHFPVAADVRFR
jgi:hypothetical protein